MERDVVPSWTSRSFPLVPRKSNDSGRLLADFRVASRTGNVPSSTSRVVARDRLSSGSFPLRRFRSSRLCPRLPHLRALASVGFGHPSGAFVSASNLPGVFRPGPSVGFSPSGPFLQTGLPSPSSEGLPSCRFRFREKPRKSDRLQGLAPVEVVTRRGLLRRRRAAALVGFVASPRFSTNRSFRRSGTPTGFTPSANRRAASRGHRPTGRGRPRLRRSVDDLPEVLSPGSVSSVRNRSRPRYAFTGPSRVCHHTPAKTLRPFPMSWSFFRTAPERRSRG